MIIDIDKYEPVGDQILCELLKITMSKGGMHIPDTAQKHQKFMQVIMKGEMCTPRIKIGDFVIIGPTNSATPFMVDKREMLQFPEHVIIGKLNVDDKSVGKSVKSRKKATAAG